MTKITKQFGLIGYPLSHSFSKKYFSEKFEKEGIEDCHYELFPLGRIEDLTELLKSQSGLVGLNVTIPYKQAVFPFLDEIDEEALAVGAVNTIKIQNGKLKGFNTDVYGFEVSLMSFLGKPCAPPNPLKGELPPTSSQFTVRSSQFASGGSPSGVRGARVQKALILGTGGAAKAVAHVLKKLNIEFSYVSRKKQNDCLTYKELDEFLIREHTLIINTTPLGMSPNLNSAPDIPYEFLTESHYLYDLVYNPEKTLFLTRGILQNARTHNGLEMLYLQAEKAWEIWNSKQPTKAPF